MALSNARGWIVLTTGNKSEMATGYSTLYGDSAGGFAVIKDVPKTLVYELCRYRNGRAGFDLIPDPVLTKAPSAELRPDQRDDESLPPYSVLDPVMAGYVEGDRSADDLVAAGFDPRAVARVVGLVDRAEYKRRQMPPGVRISGKAFGKDRRMPITNHYRSTATATAGPPDEPGRPRASRQHRTTQAGRRRPLSELTPTAVPDRPGDPSPTGAAGIRRRRGLPLRARADGSAGGGVPLDRERPLRPARRVGDRHARGRGAGPPGRPEHAPRLARRAVGRAPAGAGRGRPRRAATVPSAATAALFAALSGTRSRPRARVDVAARPTEESVGPPGALPRLAGLYRVVLPRLVTTYQRHLRVVAP